MNNTSLFDFVNISFSKFPSNIKARYVFENEWIEIPESEANLYLEANTWLIYDENLSNLFALTVDQFNDIYIAADKKAQRYLEFVIDSKNNEYKPQLNIDESFNFFEEIFGDLIEKEAPIKKRWRLILDLIFNKKIYLSKYL